MSSISSIIKNDRLSNDEAAAYLGIKPKTLDIWRCNKSHIIPYYKVGRRVMYRLSDLDKFVESCRIDEQEAS